MTTTTTAATERQLELQARIAARAGKYPELDSLDAIVTVFRAVTVPWDAIARLVSDWAGVTVSGESLRRWYGPAENVTPGG